MTETPANKAVPVADQLQLALQRNLLACERTMMAWNRTALSMITFGFTIYKFFHTYHEENPASRGQHLLDARTFSLLIMGIGVFFLVLATWQHHQQIRKLRMMYTDAHITLSLGLAGLLAALGSLAFIAALFRV